MFKPSENANELFRRLNNSTFELRIKQGRTERLNFGDIVEIQAQTSEITEARLKLVDEIHPYCG